MSRTIQITMSGRVTRMRVEDFCFVNHCQFCSAEILTLKVNQEYCPNTYHRQDAYHARVEEKDRKNYGPVDKKLRQSRLLR